MSTLQVYENDDKTVNRFTLSFLSDLKAVEEARLAEEIFKAERAELEIAGDYEDYQIRVGLLEKRLTKSKFRGIPDLEVKRLLAESSLTEKNRASEKEKKEKEKQAKKARKRHKKK
jgi:hypothetical protein